MPVVISISPFADEPHDEDDLQHEHHDGDHYQSRAEIEERINWHWSQIQRLHGQIARAQSSAIPQHWPL